MSVPSRRSTAASKELQYNDETIMNLPVPNAYPQVGGGLAQFDCSWSNFTSDIWVSTGREEL